MMWARWHLLALMLGVFLEGGTALGFENLDLKATRPLRTDDLRQMRNNFAQNDFFRRMQNAVTVAQVTDLALNRSVVTGTDNSFSHKLDDWSATDQKASGRCWIFAGLNLLRTGAQKKMNLKNFEFSQSYLFFWDKLERANFFLESVIATADKPDGDRLVDFLLARPFSDGGQWDMFVSLVKKYGLVPKSAMPESESSSNSHMMNKVLSEQLRQAAKRIRDLHAAGASRDQLYNVKNEVLGAVYRILAIHMGSPPEVFDWQWRDKDNQFHRDGSLTPNEFREKYVTIDLDEYVCLVHDPRPTNSFGQTYTIAYLGNVVDGQPILYLNTEIELIKEMTLKMIVDCNEPVWFGCDVGQQMSNDLGIWDAQLFDLSSIYEVEFTFSKADRLLYHQSRMTHAMLFTGVDVANGKARRWRVENSWGQEAGKEGFFTMNDSWFDDYVYEVVVAKSRLPENLQKALKLEPVVLPPWDPMGSLAN